MENSADQGGSFQPRPWITPSEICKILHILRKPRLRAVSLFSWSIEQNAQGMQMTTHVWRHDSSTILFKQPKQLNLIPRFSQSTVSSITYNWLHFWHHRLINCKILPNLVISSWLWWIKRVLLANQNRGNILNE